MPAKWFRCPDGQKIEINDCLCEGACRMPNRCATRSYLRLVSRERVWNGTPSTTQLIRGTIGAWLQITRDYAVSPDDRAFMILGSRGHAKLEGSDDEFSTLEGYLDGPDVTGHYDVLEHEGGKAVLVDYKTSGSFKVALALGFHVVDEPTGEVYKSGKRKGQPKTRKILHRDDDFMERRDWELQLNMYRIQLERRGIHIDEMRVMCIVRDGNTWIARSRGVFRNIYYFRIARLDDAEVLAYFKRKRLALFTAIEEDKCDLVCNAHENWQGIRCTRYCEVAEHCPLGKYLMRQKEVEEVKYTTIAGLSDVVKLPKLGRLALGKKITTIKNGKPVEYPTQVDHFILRPGTPDESARQRLIDKFENLYGKEPKSVDVMLPLPDRTKVFPHCYQRWGATTMVKCEGNGVQADCIKEYAKDLEMISDADGILTVKCLGKQCIYYKTGECSHAAILMVLLPELEGNGVWYVTTTSIHSIIQINSAFAFLDATVGRINMIPLKLQRRPKNTLHEGKKRTHYPLFLDTTFSLADMQAWAQIDATKVLLELPAVSPSREDLAFETTPEDAIYTVEPSKAVEGESVYEGGGPAVLDEDISAAAQVEAEAEQREQKAQQPEPSGTRNGLTYVDAVSEMASNFDIDMPLFGEFCDSIGTKGKTFLRLKAAMEDGPTANELQKDYDAWYAARLETEEPEVEMDADPDLLL